jgi:hypothetical protein
VSRSGSAHRTRSGGAGPPWRRRERHEINKTKEG